MANSPSVNRDTFNGEKRYFGGKFQKGQRLFDWDVNQKEDTLRFFISNLAKAVANNTRIVIGGVKSFEIIQSASPSNNLTCRSGFAVVNGRICILDSNLEYTDTTNNYIVKGKLTSAPSEITPSTLYGVVDTEKVFSSNYSLTNCRIRFTSGALSGQTFSLHSTPLSGQTVRVSGNISTAAEGDSYTLLPPALSTPSSDDQEEEIYLVTWYEDVSSAEDTDLEDPVFEEEPSHANELRFCLHKGWAGVNQTNVLSGHYALLLATVTRDTGDANVNTADISNEDNFGYSLLDALAELESVNTDLTADITALDTRLDTAETDITSIESDVDDLDAEVLKLNYVEKKEISFSKAQSNFISYTDDDVTLANVEMIGGYEDLDATSPCVVNVTGTTQTNAIAESSGIYINTESNGSSTLVWGASAFPQDSDKIFLAGIYADTGSPHNVQRMFPMGDVIWQQGFNWRLETTSLKITPGQAYRWGQLYQHPDEIGIDPTSSSNWDTGVVDASTDDWVYVYLLTTTNKRTLTCKVSISPPKWNGEHPTSKAFCIGVFNWQASISAICKDGLISFRTGDVVLLNSTGPQAADTGSLLVIQPPSICSEVELSIKTILDASTDVSGEIYMGSSGGGSSGFDIERPFTFELGTAGVSQFQYLRVPVGSSGENRRMYVSSDAILTDESIYITLCSMRFNPIYTPDAHIWKV